MITSSSDHFLHGASWVRADFHLHTIKESHSSRKKLRDEWRNVDGTLKNNEFIEAFVERLKAEDIRVACITNHDTLDYDEYKAIAKRAKTEKILVLPGVELNVHGGFDGIHTLVIFNPDDLNGGDSRVQDFLRGQYPGGKTENNVTQDELPKCLEKLEKLDIGYFIVFAHVDSDNGLLKALKGPNLQQLYQSCKTLWSKRVLGFQKIRRDERIIRQQLDKIIVPAFVEGSDPCHSVSEVGDPSNGICFLKISDLSFASVKFALKDHRLRVRCEPPASDQRMCLVSLEILTKSNGLFGHFFSKDLNCLIGSRGAGKSLIIESMRWVLGKESGVGDDTYKQGLLDAFLQKGGSVILHGLDGNGDAIELIRHYLGKRDQSPPEVKVNGVPSRVSPEILFPGLLYFGQKDLGIRSEQSDNQLFDQLLGPLQQDLSDSIESKRSKLIALAEKYQAAKKAKETDDEYAYELKALSAKLNEFKQKGVEEKLKEITLFDNDLRLIRVFLRDFAVKDVSAQDSCKALVGVLPDFPELKSVENSEAAQVLADVKKTFEELVPHITSVTAAIHHIHDKLSHVSKLIEDRRDALQSRFAEILRSIDEPDLDLDGYRKMVSRQKQLVELREISQKGSSAIATVKRELIAVGDQWIEARQAAVDYRNAQLAEINAQLPDKLNLEIEAFGEKGAYDEFLGGLLRGTNFTANARQVLVDSSHSGFEIFKRWSSFKSEMTDAMASKFEDVLEQRFVEIVTYAAPDSRHVTFDGKRINELSLGKRAMALLVLLLSLKDYPIIIIDQPEDDLDNETIHRMIVEPLREHKGNTQFIVATHNPNIPVLADAEQVIDCHETEKGQYEQFRGSLDKPSTKNAIITIMEGGEEAFERRHEIYSQWTK